MILLNIFGLVWTIRIIWNVISFTQLWYVKEYRFDRMQIHLRTNQGKRLYFLPFRRPPLSIKSTCIVLCTLFFLGSIYTILPFVPFFRFIILDLASFPITALFVAMLGIPTVLVHAFKIRDAIRMLQAHKKMTVIGITGSYGKTSTKEILATLMEKKFSVLKTFASKNSPIAIAELVLNQLKRNQSAFVVEMGAYKRGEIAKMCDMVNPEIAIITAINEQHQDLFGSIQSTINAKYELISHLRGDRRVIISADNSYTRQMGKRAQTDGCTVLFYSTQHNPIASLYATDIKESDSRLEFNVHINEKKYTIEVALLGIHHVSNILAAIGGSLAAGMSMDDIVARCRYIHAYDHTMQQIHGTHGSIFIDDTFNNNPDAAIAAISYIQRFTKRKFLIFQPMIELGAFACEAHVRVGKKAAEVCDDIIVTNDNFGDDFKRGVRAVHPKMNVHTYTSAQAVEYIRHMVKEGDVVLFKGKESARVLSGLTKDLKV